MEDKTKEKEEGLELVDNPFERGLEEGKAAAMDKHKEGLLNAIHNFYEAEAKKRPGVKKVKAKKMKL